MMVSAATGCDGDVRRRPKCARTWGTIPAPAVKDSALRGTNVANYPDLGGSVYNSRYTYHLCACVFRAGAISGNYNQLCGEMMNKTLTTFGCALVLLAGFADGIDKLTFSDFSNLSQVFK